MSQDWPAVGAAIRARLDDRGMTMTELATRSGVSLTTVRELVHVLNERRRQPRTLASLSSALDWPADHLGGQEPAPGLDQGELTTTGEARRGHGAPAARLDSRRRGP